MAKPDLQPVYVDVDASDGQLSRLRGNLGLTQVFGSADMIREANQTNAISAGLKVGGIWIRSDVDHLMYRI